MPGAIKIVLLPEMSAESRKDGARPLLKAGKPAAPAGK